MKKKAVVIPIDDHIKVVFGTSVKTFKLSEAKTADNVQFMDRLFSDFDVLTVEQISALTKEEFNVSLDALVGGIDSAPVLAVAAKSVAPSLSVPKPPVQKKKGDGLWFKSMTGVVVILNDVEGEKTSRNNVEFKQNVIIYPNRAINLGRYDKEQLKKSSCLRKLINDGDLIPCTQEEASLIEKRYYDSQSTVPRGFDGVNGSYFSSGSKEVQDHADVIEIGGGFGGGGDRHAGAVDVDVDSNTRDDIMRGDAANVSIDDLLEGT
jgi:hypothetical protein